jgi:hypothetical protein
MVQRVSLRPEQRHAVALGDRVELYQGRLPQAHRNVRGDRCEGGSHGRIGRRFRGPSLPSLRRARSPAPPHLPEDRHSAGACLRSVMSNTARR